MYNFVVSIVLVDGLAQLYAGTILYMRPANERRRYTVTPSLIGWAHSEIGPCICLDICRQILTLKQLGNFSRHIILFPNTAHYEYTIFAWNRTNAIKI